MDHCSHSRLREKWISRGNCVARTSCKPSISSLVLDANRSTFMRWDKSPGLTTSCVCDTPIHRRRLWNPTSCSKPVKSVESSASACLVAGRCIYEIERLYSEQRSKDVELSHRAGGRRVTNTQSFLPSGK